MNSETYKNELQSTIGYYREEISALRLGRAHPGLVENVPVNYYGTPTALKQLASITVTDAHTLTIQPWDKNAFKEVEQSLQKADLGASPTNDGSIIRLIIPQMTEERRIEMVKKLHEISEKYKIRVRKIREDHNKIIKKEKDAGNLSEDQFFIDQKELQEEIDSTTNSITELTNDKEKEITTI